GKTLQPPARVREASLRRGDGGGASAPQRCWDGRGHFCAAAAEAMRRILVEGARRKKRGKHGGDRQRVDLEEHDVPVRPPPDEILALDESLSRLAGEDPEAVRVVQLHFLAGLSSRDVAWALGVSRPAP